MTIHDMLKEKSITKYSLSKKSGIDWETLSDICSGKIPIATCSVDILQKLALAVGISMDDILLLEDGKPEDSSYLEMNLSLHLSKSIEEYMLGKKNQVSYLDCLWGELYGSINADFWSGVISQEQAEYLRRKYL